MCGDKRELIREVEEAAQGKGQVMKKKSWQSSRLEHPVREEVLRSSTH